MSTAVWGQLPSLIDLSDPIGLEASPLTRIFGDDPDDQLGNFLSNGIAFGDFNGDGFDDTAVGVRAADQVSRESVGEVIIIYGHAFLQEQPTFNLNTSPGSLGETRVIGNVAGDHAGSAVTAGDVDGDGYDDVILSAREASTPAGESAGEVVILYGRPSLPQISVIDLSDPLGTHGETRILSNQADSDFGIALATGDFNADGFADVLIGQQAADPGGVQRAGAAVIVYGASDLSSQSVIDLGLGTGVNGETWILGKTRNDNLGFSVCTGDLDGDGQSDAVLGTQFADLGERVASGVALLVFGDMLRDPGSVIDLSLGTGVNGETWIYGAEQSDWLSNSVATGDVNGDGFDDLVAGATQPLEADKSGEVVVIYGASALRSHDVIDLATDPLPIAATIISGGQAGENLGYSTSCGDINADGFADILFGARYADLGPGERVGRAMVIHGSSGLAAQTAINVNSTPPDVTILGSAAGDRLGHGAEGGSDLDRDGFSDFAFSALNGDNPDSGLSDSDEGYAILVYGSSGGDVASVKRFTIPGDGPSGTTVPPTNFGPVVRCRIDFSDGDTGSDGSGEASLTTVTIDRSKNEIQGLNPFPQVSESHWLITTDRVGWDYARVTFQYTDSDIAKIAEAHLSVVQADSVTGEWTRLPTTLNTLRNEISVTVTQLSHFAILGNLGVPLDGVVPTDLMGINFN